MSKRPARWSAEVEATKTMLTRTEAKLGMTPQILAADAAYGSGLMLGWLAARGIEPHIPILDHEHQTNGFFTRADFVFDSVANTPVPAARLCAIAVKSATAGLWRTSPAQKTVVVARSKPNAPAASDAS